jgi:hypothetical protein
MRADLWSLSDPLAKPRSRNMVGRGMLHLVDDNGQMGQFEVRFYQRGRQRRDVERDVEHHRSNGDAAINGVRFGETGKVSI